MNLTHYDSLVCFVAGKTGGHILPCLSLLSQMQHNPQKRVKALFFTTNSTLDQYIIKNNNEHIIKHVQLPLTKTDGVGPLRLAWDAGLSMLKSFLFLLYYRPHKIISTGGSVSIPVVLMGRILGITIELFELNAVPGKAVMVLAPYVNNVMVCFTETRKIFNPKGIKTTFVPYPHRFMGKDIPERTPPLYQSYGLDPNKLTLLVLGGSQGAQSLNALIKRMVSTYPRMTEQIQLIHQLGGNEDIGQVSALYTSCNMQHYVCFYSNALHELYTLSDIVITRAGAGGIFETAFFKKPTILIPLVLANNDHQVANAYAIQRMYPSLFTIVMQERIEIEISLLYLTIIQTIKAHINILMPSLSSASTSAPDR